MGARPSTFRKGGGFLNEVDAKITGYEFSLGDEVIVKSGQRKGEPFTPLSFVPQFRVDGADEDVTQRLLIGDAADFGEISEDARTLTTPEGQAISLKSEAGIFIASLCENGFDENRLSDDPDSLNYEPIIGERVRLVQVVDTEKTKRQGKQKGKDGREYDRRNLMVARVYDAPVAAASKANGKVAAPRPTSAPTTTTSPSKGKTVKGKANGALDVSIEARDALVAVLEANDGVLSKAKLRMKLLTRLTGKTANRDEIIKYLYDDAHLANLEGVTYDPTDSEQMIALA